MLSEAEALQAVEFRATRRAESNQYLGSRRPHVGRKSGMGHKSSYYSPAPAAFVGIDAYTFRGVQRIRLDGKELRETSLLMCQPGLPEGLSKAKASNPGPGHYNAPERIQRTAPRPPRQTSLKGCEWDKGIQQPGLPPSSSKWTRSVPGPGAYQLALPLALAPDHPGRTVHDVGPCLSIGGKMANSQRATSQIICQPELPVGMSKARAANPGPGYYERFDTENLLYAVAPSFGQATAKREDTQIICQPGLPLLKTKGNMNNPGPGMYEVTGSIGQQVRVSTLKSGARCTIGKGKRPGNTTQEQHQARMTSARSGNGIQVSSRQRTSPSFGFGTSSRTALIDM